MFLREYVLTVYVPERGVSARTSGTYQKIIGSFSRFLQRPATVHDFCQVNHWLSSVKPTLRPGTIQSYRGQIGTLWRHYWASHPESPRPNLRPAPRWQPIPWCWSAEEVTRLVQSAGQCRGYYGRVSKATWWSCLIQLGWQTGLRRTDLHALRHSDLAPRFSVSQHKSGRLVHCALSSELLDAIQSIPFDPIFKLPKSEEAFRQAFRSIVRRAGVRPGGFKFIRKSSGNWAEAQSPGTGCLLLGNEPRTFARHYLDPSTVKDVVPRPPHLGHDRQ